MAKEQPNRIAELRKAKGMTQSYLADRLGIHWVTLSKLERGKIQLHTGWMEAIAEVLGVDQVELISKRPLTKEIAIIGSIGDEGRYVNFADENNEREEFEIDITIDPEGSEYGLWVLIEGDRCWPFFHDGDKLHFTPIDPENGSVIFGRYCLVASLLGDNDHETFAGFVSNGSKPGHVNVQVINGRLRQDMKVGAIAVLTEVRFSLPGEMLSYPRDQDPSERDSLFSLAPLT